MKKTIILVLSMLMLLQSLSAQGTEKQEIKPEENNNKQAYTPHWSIGALIEANMNAPEYYSLGTGAYAIFTLPDFVKIGDK